MGRWPTVPRLSDPGALLVGAIIAVVVYSALIAIAGLDEFVGAVGAVPPRTLVTILATALLGLAAMGLSFYLVTRTMGLGFSPVEAALLFTTVNLAHNLTPFGQAGGEPLGALVISRRSHQPYERCLAAISAIDVINFAPAILVFVVGGGYIALFDTTVPTEVRPFVAAFAVLVIGVGATIGAILRYPNPANRLLARLVGSLNRLLSRVPGVPTPEHAALLRRLDTYTAAIGSVAADRRTLRWAATLSTIAIVAQGVVLWLAVVAVDLTLPLMLAIFIVPVSLLASAIPLPGGGGGIEAVQILIIVGVTGAAVPAAITAVVLGRGIVYWTPTVLGAATIAGIHLLERRRAGPL